MAKIMGHFGSQQFKVSHLGGTKIARHKKSIRNNTFNEFYGNIMVVIDKNNSYGMPLIILQVVFVGAGGHTTTLLRL